MSEAAAPAAPVEATPEADVLDDAAPAEGAKADATPAPAAEADKTESKPADDKKAGEDGGKADDADLLADDDKGNSDKKADGDPDADKSGAPETYEAFTLPDGVAMDEAVLAKATPVLKEAGLTQENAQKLVTLFAEVQAEAQAAQVAGFEQVKKDWRAELKADQEFGGDNLSKTAGAAKSFLQRFGTPRLLNDLREWGWSNHPDLLKALAKANAHFSEDTLITADAAHQTAPKTAAEVLWPGMFQSKE